MTSQMLRARRALLVLVTGLLVLVTSAPAPAAPGLRVASGTSLPVATTGQHVGVWESALQGRHGVSPDTTVRVIARVSVGVQDLRVRLGNPFGSRPVQVREVWMGLPVANGVARLRAGSNRQVTFGGRAQVSVPPGELMTSDVVDLRVGAGEDVAVSIYAPGSEIDDQTFPPFAFDPPASYVGRGGNTAREESGDSFPMSPVLPGSTGSTATGYHPGQTWWVDLVSGRAQARGTLVTLGDSITVGHAAEGPPGQRWTDVLADRYAARSAATRLAVANAGISGNTVSRQPNPYDPTGQCCGPPAPERLRRDVLSVPGAAAVLLLEGTNDIGGGEFAPPASARQVMRGMREIIRRVHARGLPIVGATILPMCNPAGGAKEAVRLRVNRWIRTGGAFDAVLDFDAVLRDPNKPTEMMEDLRHDCYHPNAAGDALLGSSIDLRVIDRVLDDYAASRRAA